MSVLTPEARIARETREAERALLGAILIAPERFGAVVIEPQDFSTTAHARAWSVLADLHASGIPIDPITVTTELDRRGWLAEVGGKAAVLAWTDGMPRTANVAAYAEIIRTAAARRRASATTRRLQAALTEVQDPWEAIHEAEQALRELEARQARIAGLNVAEQWESWGAAVERAATGPRIGLGLPGIDQVLGGIQPGEVLGVMARPGIGKTLVLCHIAAGLAGVGHVCFSLEMPAPQIVERLARMVYGQSGYALRRARREGTLDATPYAEAFSRLWLDATPGLSVSQMASRVRLAQAGTSIVAVSIDHLGLIGGDLKLTTYDRVSKQARELKELAKRCDVAVILLIQANRDAGGDGSRELHLGSARDSGVIEEACDYLVALRRLDRSTTLAPAERERYRDLIFAKVLKHRHGVPMTDEIAYRIDGISLRLEEAPGVQAESSDLRRLAQVGVRR